MMCQHFLRNIPLKPSGPGALSTGILLTALSISSLVNGTEIQSRPSCWDTNCIEIARRIREWLHLKQHEFHPILIGVFTAIIVIIRFILIHDEWSVHWNEVNKRISYQHGYENFLNISLFKSISMDYGLHATLVSIPTIHISLWRMKEVISNIPTTWEVIYHTYHYDTEYSGLLCMHHTFESIRQLNNMHSAIIINHGTRQTKCQ